jgi:hypothetical protein
MRKVLHGELYAEGIELPKLLADWSSCVRFAYNRFREGSGFDAVRVAAKEKYPSLSTRQVSDAVKEAQGKHECTKNQEPIVFGGKRLFAKVCAKQVPAERWRLVRDGMMYARGDKTKSGNPTFRILADKSGYRLRVVVGERAFRFYCLSMPAKFQAQLDDLLKSGMAYNVRLRRKSEKVYSVTVDYEIKAPKLQATFTNGCLGVDVNPDRIAICQVTPDGNRLSSQTFVNTRLFHGSKGKTNYEVGCLAQRVTDLAAAEKVGIAAESLKFRPNFVKGFRKSNRMKARFVWRKFLTALEAKCQQKGIEFRQRNPAMTTIQGRLKYRQMFSVPSHEAAAYVIGRRAMGFGEKVSVYQIPAQVVRGYALQTLQEAKGASDNRRFHSWSLWRKLDNVPVLTERRPYLYRPRERYGSKRNGRSGGGKPPREPVVRLGHYRKPILQPTMDKVLIWLQKRLQAEERRPCEPTI